MKKILFLSTSAIILSLSATANAGGSDGYVYKDSYQAAKDSNYFKNEGDAWYVSGFGLASLPNQEETTLAGVSGKTKDKTGYGVLGSAGRIFTFGTLISFRAEGELGWRHVDANSFKAAGITANADGGTNVYSALANGYYDFKNDSAFTPYIGAGLGAAMISTDKVRIAGVPGNLNDDDTVFAYQGIAGLSYAIDKNWSARAEYRYFKTSEADFTTSVGAAAKLKYDSSDILAGVSYKFN